MLYEDCKVYGPYKRKDDRYHVVIIWDDGKRQAVSYPRFLMEKHLDRYLSKDEHIDHINDDKTDNRIENLQILSQYENSIKEITRPERKRKCVKFICPLCGIEAVKYKNHVINNENKIKSGPFCSRRCAGIWSTTIKTEVKAEIEDF